LGQGAFAEVFLARKKRSSVLLALKVIDKVRIVEDSLKKYIYAERAVLTEINHPFLLHADYCLQDFTHLYILA
jgi:serine/threonine kinase 38